MSIKKAAPRQENSFNNTSKNNTKKKPTKLDSMLKQFASGKPIHKFEAETLGDHSLSTTISDLQRRHNILFNRKYVEVPTKFGNTNVMSYWLAGESLINVRSILRWRVAG